MPALALALFPLGMWSAALPYAGAALGFDVGVDRLTELVDHVVPGAVALAAASVLRRARAGSPAGVASAAAAGLAGLLATVSHLPLIADAGRPPVTWAEAVWHASAGPPLLVVGAALFALELRRA